MLGKILTCILEFEIGGYKFYTDLVILTFIHLIYHVFFFI